MKTQKFSRHAILKAAISENMARLKDDRTSVEGKQISRENIEAIEKEVAIAVDAHAGLLAQNAALVAVAQKFIAGCRKGEQVGEVYFSQLLDEAARALLAVATAERDTPAKRQDAGKGKDLITADDMRHERTWLLQHGVDQEMKRNGLTAMQAQRKIEEEVQLLNKAIDRAEGRAS